MTPAHAERDRTGLISLEHADDPDGRRIAEPDAGAATDEPDPIGESRRLLRAAVEEVRSRAEAPAHDEHTVGGATVVVRRADNVPPRRIAREGDRVDGWVRPEYGAGDDITGDYWTPVPDGGYGWPVPVERLPAVPTYPPASGFDRAPVNEPTAVVPPWPPARPSDRVEAPRSWRANDEETRRGADSDAPDERRWAERDRQSPPRWPLEPADPEPQDRRRRAKSADQPAWSRLGQRRRVSPVTEHIPAVADSTQMLPSVDGLVAAHGDADRSRSRPRPRPRPQQQDKSTVYVSKHAADPS